MESTESSSPSQPHAVTLGPRELHRAVPDVPLPIASRLDTPEVFPSSGVDIDVDRLREHFLGEGKVTHSCATEIVKRATEIMDVEPNVLELFAPLTGTQFAIAQFLFCTVNS